MQQRSRSPFFNSLWVMEPVRREGSLGRKFHGNKRALDWWTVEKPLGWDPAEEGRKVSLNHDYGRPDQPAGKQAAKSATPPAPAGKRPVGPARTLLAMGAQAAKESGAGKGQSASEAGAKGHGADEESWAYRNLVPPLWKQDGHPEKEWAKEGLKKELEEWAGPFTGFPDKIVTPIQIWGDQRKKNGK
ncbi:MAG: hypothetical protein AB7E51_11895 [Pseudodesulfovibrio sp.]|uniref:hypothetical protein n=1 Tax=Pseudodesulfovibrio sp. TaxID=2035812 RepID=UPI003D0BBBD0